MAACGRCLWAQGAFLCLPAVPAPCLRSAPQIALSRRPAHALYFAAYEAAKKALGGSKEGHHPFAVAAAGVFATLTSDACMTPFDVVKQRLQVRFACRPSNRAALCTLCRCSIVQAPLPHFRVTQDSKLTGGEEPIQGRLGLRVENMEGGGHRRILQVLPNDGASV